ncbi:MAG: chromate efflux transporter [Acidobacteriota bacterium]|nr:MAG: chromate efflux transporter [Acidobacteriota bacterium]
MEVGDHKLDVSFRDALRFWIKLGFISFGGPAGQIAIMHKELVERRGWIDDKSFLNALNFCMLLPGPEAQQLATYIGWRLHKIKGGIAAGAMFVVPSAFLLLILSFVYARYGTVSEVAAVLDGFKPVVVAIVVEAVIKIGNRSLITAMHFAIAIFAFVGVQFLNVPFPLIVLAALLFGLFASRNSAKVAETVGEPAMPTGRFHFIRVALACFLCWLIPLAASLVIFGRESVATKLYLFFTQAAFVTFGGAYAVLAYVNQAAVGAGWITSVQAVDGLALAETTPGPLIMVLQFVGFMTGWQNAGNFDQTFFAVACALLVTFATFLPSFLFIFGAGPYLEKISRNSRLSGALGFVTAAVVGVILNLSVVFGAAVVWQDHQLNFFAAAAAVAAFVALFFFKVDVVIVVIAGGAIRLLKHLFVG